MIKEDFLILLKQSSVEAYDFAKNYIIEDLPLDFQYIVALNVSNDSLDLIQFDIYPNDNGKITKPLYELEVIELLYRKGKVPVWIDISVEHIYKDKTIFKLLCSGRFTANDNELYYKMNGTAPFGVKSPNLSVEYVEGKKFNLKQI